MIVDPDSEIGRMLGITQDSYRKQYMCPRCSRLSNSRKCPNCGTECNEILP